MQDVEREKSMKLDFVDEFGESEERQSQRLSKNISETFFDPPLAEEDTFNYLSHRSSSLKRKELMSSHQL